MVVFRGNAAITNGQITNTKVQSSQITASSLDMNGANITSVADPVQDQDAATKFYVDQRASSAGQIYTITLTGSSFTSIAYLSVPGAYFITVGGGPSGSAVAVFTVAKSSAGFAAQVFRIGSQNASTGEDLQLQWPPNSPVVIRKNGTAHDGTYQVKIL